MADASGNVLSAPGGPAGDGSAQTQMVGEVQNEYRTKLQSMLDRVLGPGNSTVQVTADLDFDDAVVETKDYTANADTPPASSRTTSETYNGPGNQSPNGGVVGPDGQMDTTTAGGDSSYNQTSKTEDNVIDERTERRVSAPGSLAGLHVGVALDSTAMNIGKIDTNDIHDLVVATAGIDAARGDTVAINEMAFDRTSEKAASEALAAAETADAAAKRRQQFRDIGLGLLVALAVIIAIFAARRRAKKRDQATNYLVDQIRQDRVTATQVMELPAAQLALEESDLARDQDLRQEIDDLIERQPDDVASLLRGWLAEHP
jgi:flagellar M-ring protein FliF